MTNDRLDLLEALGGARQDADKAPRFGEKLRDARKRSRMTQAEVASRVGVSKGFLSQLEHNNSQVSVAKLLLICEVIGIEIGALFQTSSSALVRKGDRVSVNLGGHGVSDFLLTPPNKRGLRILETTVQPLGTSGDEPYVLRNELETVHVASGSLEVTVDGELFELAAGDTMTFAGDSLHTWRNPSTDEEAKLFWTLIRAS